MGGEGSIPSRTPVSSTPHQCGNRGRILKQLSDYLYYEEDDLTIYCGDCLEIMPLLPKVDLVVTDPPYGIGADKKNAQSSIRDNPKWEDHDWDKERPSGKCFNMMYHKSKDQIIWGGNYFADLLPPSSCWLVWRKPEAESGFSLADAELAWTSFDSAVRIKSIPRRDGNQHPTQKPVLLIKWAIQQCKYWETPISILDPFLGSGTTLVACKELGRKGIGIEINPKYCEIAKRRLQNTQRMML